MMVAGLVIQFWSYTNLDSMRAKQLFVIIITPGDALLKLDFCCKKTWME